MTKRKWTNQEVRDWMDKNHTHVYYNPSDSNLFVRKRFGIGWTANIGNPMTYVLCIGVVLLIYCVMRFGA